MKLMLIRPPFAAEKFYTHCPEEPLGIEYLASFTNSHHEVRILDAVVEDWNNYWQGEDYPEIFFQGLDMDGLLRRISEFKPEIIGLSWPFASQDSGIELMLKTIRQYDKKIKIIVGGPRPSASPKETLQKYKDIDIVAVGEGEFTLLELLDRGAEGLEKIKGLAYRVGNNIVVNQPRELIKDLDILPLPLRDSRVYGNYSRPVFNEFLNYRFRPIISSDRQRQKLINWINRIPLANKFYYYLHNSKKNINQLPFADMLTSRGCPNHCTFCAIYHIWGHNWRPRSINNVLEEIEILVRKFGIKHINFVDDNFNISKDRVIGICKNIVSNGYNISLAATSGIYVPTLDEEVLFWLKQAGVNLLRMSIESGNQEILNNVIRKNINLKQVADIVKSCKKIGIRTEGAFIFGLPGETLETMQDTVNYAKTVGFDRVIKFIYQPFPNTVLYDLCVAKGYLTADFDPKRSYVTGSQCYVRTEKFTPEDVKKIARF